jgi:hypothetical protein
MKKTIIILLFIPFFSFCQDQSNKKNGIENLLKQAEKLVENIDIDFNKKRKVKPDENLEKKIVSLWKNYSKAFEYKDYDKIASYFSYPSIFGISNNPTILYNKKELIDRYVNTREKNIQEGYRYSLLEDYELIELSPNTSILKATYSRYNINYNKVYTGKGVYFYKRVNGDWKLYCIDSI